MIIANTADLHLRGKDLPACKAQLAALVDECLARKVDLLTVAGDIFDHASHEFGLLCRRIASLIEPGERRSAILKACGDMLDRDRSIGEKKCIGSAAEVAIEAVSRLTANGIEVLMIPGNHDKSGPMSDDMLYAFDGMPGVTIMRKECVRDFGSIDDERATFIACVPWDWSGRNAEDVIRSLMPANILLAHIQVVGARLSGSHTCDAAPGKWQVSREFLDSLPVDHIALGDFHTRQLLFVGPDQRFHQPKSGGYIGALRQCNFGEEGNPAGFEIYNTETGVTEWVELDAAPKHYTTIITDESQLIDAPGFNSQCKIRVRFDGITPDRFKVRNMEMMGVQVEQIIEREERVRRADVPEGVLSDRHGLIRLWAEAQHPPVDGARLERMTRTLDGLYADRGGQAEA